jgi:hypothetical protein
MPPSFYSDYSERIYDKRYNRLTIELNEPPNTWVGALAALHFPSLGSRTYDRIRRIDLLSLSKEGC